MPVIPRHPGVYTAQQKARETTSRVQALEGRTYTVEGGAGTSVPIFTSPRPGQWDVVREAERRSLQSFAGADWSAITNTIINDTAFIPGDELYFRPGTYPVAGPTTVTKPCRITGRAATIMWPGNKAALDVRSDDVLIDELTFQGVGGIVDSNTYAIYCQAESYVDAYRNLKIRDVTVRDCPYVSMWLRNIAGFDIRNCTLTNQVYAGIHGQSVTDGRIIDNTVDGVTRLGMSGPTGNSYGIYVSGTQTDDLVNMPHAERIMIRGNRVWNCVWEGINTHGGRHISFIDNEVYGCQHGINAVGRNNQLDVAWANGAPLYIKMIGNTVDSLRSDGSLGAGIRFGGASNGTTVMQYAKGEIANNLLINCGNDVAGSGYFGALYIGSTVGVSITGNIIENPAVCGIRLNQQDLAFTMTGNTITEPWANNGAAAACIISAGNNNRGTVANNQHWETGSRSSAAKKNQAFFRFSSSSVTLQAIDWGINNDQCDLPAVNVPPTAIRWSAFQSRPVPRLSLSSSSSAADIVSVLEQKGVAT